MCSKYNRKKICSWTSSLKILIKSTFRPHSAEVMNTQTNRRQLSITLIDRLMLSVSQQLLRNFVGRRSRIVKYLWGYRTRWKLKPMWPWLLWWEMWLLSSRMESGRLMTLTRLQAVLTFTFCPSISNTVYPFSITHTMLSSSWAMSCGKVMIPLSQWPSGPSPTTSSLRIRVIFQPKHN